MQAMQACGIKHVECSMLADVACRYTQHACTLSMLAHSAFLHTQHAGTLSTLARSAHLHTQHAGTLSTLARSACRHTQHACTLSMQTHAAVMHECLSHAHTVRLNIMSCLCMARNSLLLWGHDKTDRMVKEQYALETKAKKP